MGANEYSRRLDMRASQPSTPSTRLRQASAAISNQINGNLEIISNPGAGEARNVLKQ